MRERNPSIDPLSPQNQARFLGARHQILHRIGLLGSPADGLAPTFGRGDGTMGRITGTASVVPAGTLGSTPHGRSSSWSRDGTA